MVDAKLAGFPQAAWLVRAGLRDELIEAFEQQQAIALALPDYGDPTGLLSADEILGRLTGQAANASSDRTRSDSWQLGTFIHSIKIGDYVLADAKPTQELLVGRIASEFEYTLGVFGSEYPYIRRVHWCGRLSRSRFTPEAQRDLYSVIGISDLRQHLAQIDALLSGETFAEDSGMGPLVRGETVIGESFRLYRPAPSKMIVDRLPRYYAKHLARQLLGLLLTVTTIWVAPRVLNVSAFGLTMPPSSPLGWLITTAIILSLVTQIPGLWKSLNVALHGVEVVFDSVNHTVSVNGRSICSFADVGHVEIRSSAHEVSEPEGGPTTRVLEHELALVLRNGRALELAKESGFTQLLHAARPLAHVLQTQIVRVSD
jgi:hypothetical protein